MLARLRAILLLPLAALVACGNVTTATTTTTTGITYAATSGDYVITVAPGTANASTFTGNLNVVGTSISGVFRYNNPGKVCVSGTQDIAFTGSTVNGIITLTSAAFASSVATLTIALPLGTNSSGQQLASGTALITGGACALASTTAQTQFIPSFAGTWNSTLTGPATGAASVVLTEAGADADGQFPATAAISFSSSTSTACNFSVPIAAPISGLVSGAVLQAQDSTTSPTITLTANASVTPITVSVTTSVPSGNSACGGTYTGTLTH
jgi:hypothetical protein